MPTANPKYLLACYFDVSDISFALVSLNTYEVKLFNFPFSYSREAFFNQTTEGGFNKSVIELILKTNKIKPADVEIITLGFLQEIPLDMEVKYSAKLPDLLRDVKIFYPFIVNRFTVITKEAIMSYEPMPEKKGKSMDSEESDEFANLSIYPQLVPVDIPTITNLDKNISSKMEAVTLSYPQDVTLTFSGSRFSRNTNNEYLDWILAIDLVRNSGVYKIAIDRKNIIPLSALISKYKPEININEDTYLEVLGTIVNSPGDTECLINSELGTGQFFDVKKDMFYAVPSDKDTSSSISVKSHDFGNYEKTVKGGKVGIMVKTIGSASSIYENVKVFNDTVSQLSLCMHRS